ncbi:STAS domain-containing protein [Streptomyces sp. SID8375]|uniref:STAS domain-containing protein n=1 Tax=unclassified Streptomyces TaxID=2593676 RepID=UPI00037CD6C9|nr:MULTISPECIES: STAS domain-containing protein [unclassified Streptomyces]MYX07432.1 STAS domain-containing protein [Streptomyces sp. SID8375]
MTAPPSDDRSATIATQDRHTAHLHLSGDLDHTTADELLALAVRQIAAQPGLRDLHLNCAQVRACDPMGLSVLPALHRRTSAAGIHLHLDDRPPALDRLLTVTGTLGPLASPPGRSSSTTG